GVLGDRGGGGRGGQRARGGPQRQGAVGRRPRHCFLTPGREGGVGVCDGQSGDGTRAVLVTRGGGRGIRGDRIVHRRDRDRDAVRSEEGRVGNEREPHVGTVR